MDAWLTTGRYDYSAMTAESVRAEMRRAIETAEALIERAVGADPPTFDDTLRTLSDATWVVVAGAGRSFFPGRSHPEREVREACAAAQQEFSNWENALLERDDVAAAVIKLAGTHEAQRLAGPRRRVLELWRRELRRAGHDLDPELRGQVSDLRRRMVELGIQFERNVTEWRDELVLEPSDQEGLPESLLAQLPDGPTAGSKRLPIVRDIVAPFLEHSPRRDLRREAQRRVLSRAVDINRPILEELLSLRRQVASLLGFDSWSDYANAARMSGNAAAVTEFLSSMIPPLQQLAEGERQRMAELLEESGVGDEVRAWDWQYCHERQKEAAGVSGAELKEHFPLEAALDGMFDLAREVFGVSARPLREAPTWHSDILVFELSDTATGEHLCDLYMDLFNREGKPPGAWTYPLRPAWQDRDGSRQPAAMAFGANFAPAQAGRSALLEHYDVEVMFHEFGHVLEFGLQRTDVFQPFEQAIETDYVEAPSQIMENWVWEPDVVSRFARHHATDAAIRLDLLRRLKSTRHLNSGTSTLWGYVMRAVLDQLLHGPEWIDPEQAYRDAVAVTGLPFPEDTFLPASFTHITAMYDAGFYSYLWAQVFGYDMFSEFAEKGVLSPEVGRRYRAEVLEPSWSTSGRDRTRNFLRREPSEQALLQALGIKSGG